jgi:hypothetical protein
MKKITSFELTHTIVSHEKRKRVYEIKVSKIYHLVDNLEEKNITCCLGVSSFMELQDKFPNEIIIQRNSVTLKNLPRLRKNLDNQLRFFKDDDLYNIIWEAWKE